MNQCPLHTPSPIVNLSIESGSEWGGGPSPRSERRGGSWHLRHTASGGGPGPEAGMHPLVPSLGGAMWVVGFSSCPVREKGQVTPDTSGWVGTSNTSQGRMCAFLRAPAPLLGGPGGTGLRPVSAGRAQQLGRGEEDVEAERTKTKPPSQTGPGRAPGHAVPMRGLPARCLLCRARRGWSFGAVRAPPP